MCDCGSACQNKCQLDRTGSHAEVTQARAQLPEVMLSNLQYDTEKTCEKWFYEGGD